MSDENQQPYSTLFGNELINIANQEMAKGHSPAELAEGLRHAAANFSAYAFFLTDEETADPNPLIENFVRFFEYYLSVHMPKEEAGGGLAQTIAQAKDEL